jgi:cobaltochelatase CobN
MADSNSQEEQRIIFLSHADTDLSMLMSAVRELPEGFPQVSGYCLQNCNLEELADILTGQLTVPVSDTESAASSGIVVLRCLGDTGRIAGFETLLARLRAVGCNILALSGTGEPMPELAAVSTVSPSLAQDAMAYFQAGGPANIAQLLRALSDRLFLTSFSYEPPMQLPEHGIYHPDLGLAAGLADWQKLRQNRSCVGIVFYRAHWISGNLDFVDAMVREFEGRGLDVLPIFTSSLRSLSSSDGGEKMARALEFFFADGRTFIDVLVNTTAFAMGEVNGGAVTMAGWSVDALAKLDVPVLQAVTSAMSLNEWQASWRGLNALDTAMNVVLPEFDGRIMTVPISFKERLQSDQIEVNGYLPVADRVQRLGGLVARFARLRSMENASKKIAFVLTNSSSKAAQIGNAVGLDSPASLLKVLGAMQKKGYAVEHLPENGESDSIIHNLIDRCSYDQTYLSGEQISQALGRVSLATYKSWLAELPQPMQERMVSQWGAPENDFYFADGHFIIAGLSYGNAVVLLQPPRGYGVDQNAIYHQPDLPPTHHYYAFYRWIRDSFAADAVVHMGKHGTLEWLPGKSVGLSSGCFPDALLADLPLFYPFILNDPGEGSQAKRRAHAVVVDHLMPPMTSADTYGPLAELVQVVDEYYRAEVMDPAKLPLLQEQIWQLVEKANLRYDLASFIDGELAEHEENLQTRLNAGDASALAAIEEVSTGSPAGVPQTLATMDWLAVSHLIQEIDGYLCELGAAQIRDGLHILGQIPQGESLVSTLASLTRLANVGVPGLQQSLAAVFDLDLPTLVREPGSRAAACPRLEALAGRLLVSNADLIEALDALALQLLRMISATGFDGSQIGFVIKQLLALPQHDESLKALVQVLEFVCQWLVPALNQSDDEICNLLRALEGRYVPAGPSGAPTRGMAHILPTGRNFYAVDPNTLPSQAAWQVGQGLAEQVVQRYLKETGRYPETVSITAWGTSAMRTHGDDIAEVLALMGVRPVWQPENRRVIGVEVIPLAELGRPRIDVTTRISGFFRDAFPNAIDLLDNATALVVALDEPLESNFIRKHFLCEVDEHLAAGLELAEAERLSRFRVFGSKPGTYGAGILPLIQEKNWTSQEHFATAYINWGGYAYGRGEYGVDARPQFTQRLAATEVAVQNQDNREHDIFDSDDYMQFHGGLIATVKTASGKQPKRYFGDSQNPSRPRVRDLNEEVLRVFRSRVVNPKWIESIKRHGYKGAVELAATVDYMFGYDATAEVMQDWMYEQVAANYLLDEAMRQFLSQSNPWAMQAMSERLLEAAQRQMWKPQPETLKALQNLFLENEAHLEGRESQISSTGLKGSIPTAARDR